SKRETQVNPEQPRRSPVARTTAAGTWTARQARRARQEPKSASGTSAPLSQVAPRHAAGLEPRAELEERSEGLSSPRAQARLRRAVHEEGLAPRAELEERREGRGPPRAQARLWRSVQ